MPRVSWLYHPVSRFVQHLLFWAIAYLVFVQVFKSDARAGSVDYIYAALFHITLLLAVYVNLEILLPRFGNQQKWWQYFVLLLLLLVLCTWLNDRFFQDWSAYLFPDYFFISYFSWWELSLFFVVYTGLSALLKLSKSWFTVNDLQRQLLQAEKEKVQVELMALKAQVNPHFFFNTLNGIYAMALDKDERLPGTVLQLSHLMRYFLYDTREELVPLEKEWEMLQDYIALQKIRSGDSLHVEVEVDGEIARQQLPPVILITFLENAFKHGAKGNTGAVRIHLQLKLEPGMLIFRLENTTGIVDEIVGEDHKGVGLENVKRRLALIYPQRHTLHITEQQGKFVVSLKLQL